MKPERGLGLFSPFIADPASERWTRSRILLDLREFVAELIMW